MTGDNVLFKFGTSLGWKRFPAIPTNRHLGISEEFFFYKGVPPYPGGNNRLIYYSIEQCPFY